ncbi:MAG: single-stranded DNA-binding protein [Clostridia bacterium]|nr:single-stranded DNA-binding protein [Clostridia bacterium]
MSDETGVARRENNVITRQEENSPTENLFGEFNKVFVSGRIEAELEYSHEVRWEKFYRTRVRVERLSGTEDLVPIVVSDLLIGQEKMKTSLEGKWVEVAGQFRSYNKLGEDGRKHLDLFLFVRAIKIYEDEDGLEETTNANLIYLDGYLCKPPVFRKTPLGRQITNLLIEVNRPYGKSDYIPCIAWGRGAQWVSEFEVGNRVKLYGRVQSREYFKKTSPDSDAGEYRDAYEISVMRMQKVEDLRLEG